MKNLKAGSPSNGSFPNSMSTEAQKSNFHKRKSSFLQKFLFDDFSLVLACTEKRKKEKENEDEKKRGKNKNKFKEKKKRQCKNMKNEKKMKKGKKENKRKEKLESCTDKWCCEELGRPHNL